MVRVAPPVDGVSQASQMLVLLTSHVWGARIRAPQIAADETTDEIVSAADKNAAADQRIIIKLCVHANTLPLSICAHTSPRCRACQASARARLASTRVSLLPRAQEGSRAFSFYFSKFSTFELCLEICYTTKFLRKFLGIWAKTNEIMK